MAVLTIRNLDDGIKRELRLAAAKHGRSMEAEARAVLEERYRSTSGVGLGERIHARFAEVGGVELDIPARDEPARAADFES